MFTRKRFTAAIVALALTMLTGCGGRAANMFGAKREPVVSVHLAADAQGELRNIRFDNRLDLGPDFGKLREETIRFVIAEAANDSPVQVELTYDATVKFKDLRQAMAAVSNDVEHDGRTYQLVCDLKLGADSARQPGVVVRADYGGLVDEVEIEIEESLELAPIDLGSLDVGPLDSSVEVSDAPPAALGIEGTVPPVELVPAESPIIGNDDHGYDRVTQELMWQARERNVLVAWCIDRSLLPGRSRKFRQRIERVYKELATDPSYQGDRLTAAVASFDKAFEQHTAEPTSDFEPIQRALTTIPKSESGTENVIGAIGGAARKYGQMAAREDRKLVVIVVTDETGEPDTKHLEPTIQTAKMFECTVIVLASEAAFGAPTAYLNWTPPDAPREAQPHLLPMDRGPETATPELLLCDGFGPRQVFIGSGFGPYAQARICRATGGILFVSHVEEPNLISDGNTQLYDQEVLRPYRPDLRSRAEVDADNQRSKLRMALLSLVHASKGEAFRARQRFSARPEELAEQAREELEASTKAIAVLTKAVEDLETLRDLREAESSPRWQANYDLTYAELVAFRARRSEYAAALRDLVENVPEASARDERGNAQDGWEVVLAAGDRPPPTAKQAIMLLQKVVGDYAGTPWERRARWELARGFGVSFAPVYEAADAPKSRYKPLQP